jgi:NADH-quinone oxidoreductase subunit H
MKFALLFMAEYTKMIAVSAIMATLFLGGYLGPDVSALLVKIPVVGPYLGFVKDIQGPIYLLIKIAIILFGMIWVRATFPRIRYDRLMAFGWKVLLPLALALVFITAVGLILTNNDFNNPLILVIPGGSLVVGLFAVAMIDRALRRKDYARR